MKRISKPALLLALGLATTAAFAGEIKDSDVYGDGSSNISQGDQSRALQRIGVAAGDGKIHQSSVHAFGAENRANGNNARAQQDIGVAQDGRMKGVTVVANGARNRALGDDSLAVQEIGKAKGTDGLILDSIVSATNTINQANANSTAQQKIGVAE